MDDQSSKTNDQKEKQCFQEWLENPSEENHKKYRQQRKLATKAIKNALLSYYENLTKKKDKTNKSLFFCVQRILQWQKIRRFEHHSRDFQWLFCWHRQKLKFDFQKTDSFLVGKSSIDLLCQLLLIKKSLLLLDHWKINHLLVMMAFVIKLYEFLSQSFQIH